MRTRHPSTYSVCSSFLPVSVLRMFLSLGRLTSRSPPLHTSLAYPWHLLMKWQNQVMLPTRNPTGQEGDSIPFIYFGYVITDHNKFRRFRVWNFPEVQCHPGFPQQAPEYTPDPGLCTCSGLLFFCRWTGLGRLGFSSESLTQRWHKAVAKLCPNGFPSGDQQASPHMSAHAPLQISCSRSRGLHPPQFASWMQWWGWQSKIEMAGWVAPLGIRSERRPNPSTEQLGNRRWK